MTEDDFRRIIREELLAHAARLAASSEPAAPTGRPDRDALLAWVATLPIGYRAKSGDMLMRFVADTAPAPGWTAISFGMALSRIRGRIVEGRYLDRAHDRKGASVFVVTAFSRVAQ